MAKKSAHKSLYFGHDVGIGVAVFQDSSPSGMSYKRDIYNTDGDHQLPFTLKKSALNRFIVRLTERHLGGK
jgi:hypothetical protein